MLKSYKKGATSIYVVVISTLLFSVITFSFIRIIIGEVTKTTSDELAQAAYDSALAGIEDAKTALKRYYDCKPNVDNLGEEDKRQCESIIAIFEDKNKGFNSTNGDTDYCDSIAEALGRIDTSISSDGEPREVLIQEQSRTGGNRESIVQAYTCVTVDNTLDDYRGSLSASSPVRVIPLKTEEDKENSITGIRIFWYSDEDGNLDSLNYASKDAFYPIGDGTSSKPTPTPPTITAQIIQTEPAFTLDSFKNSSDGRTNRGTVVLVPSDTRSPNQFTHISASTLVASNDHDYDRESHNDPQKIECEPRLFDEFACGATIELTKPVGSDERNPETFYLVLSLPYGNPTTSFAIQLCNDDEPGGVRGDCMDGGKTSIAQFKEAQIAVDSTGRANDMYSRVEARVEFRDNFMFPEFAVYASGEDDDSLKKSFYVTDDCFDSTDVNNIVSCPNTD